MKVYVDNAATTQVDPAVLDSMTPFMTGSAYGNAQSLHSFGVLAMDAIDSARNIIAKKLGCSSEEIYFTSGGTEANNWALKGVMLSSQKGHLIVSCAEHESILEVARYLESCGYSVTHLPVDSKGLVKIDELKSAIRKDTKLVSIIHANNEVGSITDLKKIGKVCREAGVLFHTDACQSFCKEGIDLSYVDLCTLNAHKIHGPKGVGALFVRNGVSLVPLLHGGGHENGERAGTENVAGIVGFGKAVSLSKDSDITKMKKLQDYLLDSILSKIPQSYLNGARSRLCNNVNVSFAAIEGEALMSALDDRDISVSTGSACTSKSIEPSHVLVAMGLSKELSFGAIRFSISKHTTKKEIDHVISILASEVSRLRALSPLWKE